MAVIDAKTGRIDTFLRDDLDYTIKNYDKSNDLEESIPISKIKHTKTISVNRFEIIQSVENKEVVRSCQLIHINDTSKAICKLPNGATPSPNSTIADIPNETIQDLKSKGNINVSSVMVVDAKTGEQKLFKHPSYQAIDLDELADLDAKIRLKNKSTVYSMTHFRINPKCVWVNGNGSEVLICSKI